MSGFSFLTNCNNLSTRDRLRWFIETILFFGIPAFLSCILYFLVGRDLANKSRHVTRNRVLTVAFLLSWLFWILCWTPNYLIIGITNLSSQYGYYFRQYTARGIWVETFRIPLLLLYSHLNPIVYLIVLKKFQKHHVTVFKWIWRQLFLKNVSTGRNVSQFVVVKVLILMTKFTKLFQFLTFLGLIIGLTAYHVLYAPIPLNVSREVKVRPIVIYKDVKLHDFGIFMPIDWKLDVQANCFEKRGFINIEHKRCYSFRDHQPERVDLKNTGALNFDQMVESCEEINSYLCYPRSHDEMLYFQDLVTNWALAHLQNWVTMQTYNDRSADSTNATFTGAFVADFLNRYRIPLGFRKSSEKLFTSIDGRYNISSESEPWFYSWHKNNSTVRAFHGPAVCLTGNSETLAECRYTVRSHCSICCADLFTLPEQFWH